MGLTLTLTSSWNQKQSFPLARARLSSCQLAGPPTTVRMLAALLTFFTSASFYTALVMAALWLWKELTMGIYRGKERLDGKLVVTTGANCGIGLETARDLAKRGALIIVGCRSRQRGEAAVKEIVNASGNSKVEMVELDLLSLASVRRFAQAVAARPEPLSLLINNAGMADGNGANTWAVGKSHLSDDGLEITTQVQTIISQGSKICSVQPPFTLPADQPAEGQAGRGGQCQGDQRLLLRRLARQDQPQQHQLRVRQLSGRP